MIRLKLYKGAEIDETYREVFSMGKFSDTHKSPLEHYLETLTSISYELDTVYQENEGTFIFEDPSGVYNCEIYEYNYLKVETLDDEDTIMFTRYCFIESISIKNGCYYVEYKEDIWHSYSGDILGMFKNTPVISRSKLLDYENGFNIRLYKPTVKYTGNKGITINPLIGSSVNGNFNIIVEVQRYTTGESGEITDRDVDLYMFNIVNGSSFSPTLSLEKTYDAISLFVKNVSVGRIRQIEQGGTEINSRRYKVNKIYVFPSSFNLNLKQLYDESSLYYEVMQMVAGVPVPLGIRLGRMNTRDKDVLTTGSIVNNFKNLNVGTVSHRIELSNNGLQHNYYLSYTKFLNNLSIIFTVDNNMVEIADDFEIEYPVESMNSEDLSLLKIDKNVRRFNDVITVCRNLVGMGTAAVSTDANNTARKVDAIKGIDGAMLSGEKGVWGLMMGAISSELKNIGSKANLFGVIANSYFNILSAAGDFALTFGKFYTSNEGKIISNQPIFNIYSGIFLTRINSDDASDALVELGINREGYEVAEPIEDFSKLMINNDIDTMLTLLTAKQTDNNYIRFENINVYGKFPQSIAQTLNLFLTTGMIIKYKKNYGNI